MSLAQYVNKFLVRHKKFGLTQNILGPVIGEGINGFLISGVDNHDTERRRQIALKALKDRLSKTETQSASESSNWPSLEDDISTSSTTANTSENKSGLENNDATAGDTSHVQIDIENQIEANREVLEDESDDKKPLLSPEN